MSCKPASQSPAFQSPASQSTTRRLLPLLLVAAGAAVTLSGCVAYPYDGYDGAGYGYAGPVVAPSVVVAPTYRYGYRPYGYYGWRGRRW